MSGRRRFLSAVVAAPLLPAAFAQTPPPPVAPAPSPSPSPASPEAAARESVAEALTEAARRHFGDRFPADQAQDVRESIADNLRAAERLRALKLGNADEPIFAFEATATAPQSRRRSISSAASAGSTLARAFDDDPCAAGATDRSHRGTEGDKK